MRNFVRHHGQKTTGGTGTGCLNPHTTALIAISPTLSLSLGVPTQDAIVKSLRVRHGRVLMAALARTWSPVTTALVRRLTSVAPALLRTVSSTTLASTAVLVMVPGCAAVHMDTQVVSA